MGKSEGCKSGEGKNRTAVGKSEDGKAVGKGSGGKVKEKGKGKGERTNVKSDDIATEGKVQGKPRCAMEWKRLQVMARTGRLGKGQTKGFSFKRHGSPEKALEAAQKWVEEQTRSPPDID